MRPADIFCTLCGIIFALSIEFGSSRSFRPALDMKSFNVECKREGEIVSITHIPDTDCFQCICRNNTAVCQKSACPSLGTCPVVATHSGDACCKTCKTCTYLGQTYENDEQWSSGQDSCRRFTCKAGVITHSRMVCVTPCENPRPRIGYCCPMCPINSPRLNVTKQDPCIQCQCDSITSDFLPSPFDIVTIRALEYNKYDAGKDLDDLTSDNMGWCYCFRTSCPALDCAPEKRYTPPGKCCPECRGPKPNTFTDRGCFFQDKHYSNGENFRPDPCLLCKCEEGSVLCQGFTCDELNCTSNRLYYKDNVCCPFCLDQDPQSCEQNGKVYKHDESWDFNPCTKCSCRNGEINCSIMKCPFAQGCPKGYKLAPPLKGHCCRTCKEQEATCTVYGDPHYRTFDGHEYNFQGSCRYMLAKNCRLRQFKEINFSIIVKNEPRGNQWSTWTRRVTVRLGDRRVVLMPGKRVKLKIGRKRSVEVNLPYLELGFFAVSLDAQRRFVILRAVDGPKVVWDGNSFVEVTVPSFYRKNMCGLCGNYNGNKTDDHQMSMSNSINNEDSFTVLTQNVEEFAQSWRVGKWNTCMNEQDQKYHKKLDRKRRRQRDQYQYQYFHGYSSGTGRNISSVLDSPSIGQLDSFVRSKQTVKKNFGAKNFRRSQINISPKPSPVSPGSKFIKINHNGNNKRKRHKPKCWRNANQKLWRPIVAKCKLFHSHLFKACHRHVDVRSYLKNCKMDVCGCPPSGRCYCQSMLAYSVECEKRNVVLLDWRTASDCQSNYTCPMEGGVFDPCTSPCGPETCRTYNNVSRKNCPYEKQQQCVPGCKCPHGTVLHENKCVKPKECTV